MPILRHSCRLATLHFSRLTLPFSFLLAVSRHKKRAPLNADAPKVKITEKFQLRSHLKMTFSLVKYGFSQSLPPHPALSHDSQICCLLTKNIIEEYSTYVILDTVQGEADSDRFWQKANALTAGAVLVVQDDQTELWPANVVLKDDEAVYEGSCGDLVKENGVYHYSGVIEGYDEALIPAGGDWTQGFYELVRGDFYVDGSTRVVIQTDLDYGFPVNGKSANAWLDDFYARRAYWMALRIKVKGNHIEEIYGIYSID